MEARLIALQNKHALLEGRLAQELQRPLPNDVTVSRLKVSKLRVKDEMAVLLRRRQDARRRSDSGAGGAPCML